MTSRTRFALCFLFTAVAACAQAICDGNQAYIKWRDEDAAYLLTPEERSKFNQLRTEEACEAYIERFWSGRDSNPKTLVNEFKEEYYRRIAYANERFAGSVPGWRTARGRAYILYGPPDEIESHPSGLTYTRPKEEGGGTTSTHPFERWRYRSIPGVADNVDLEFIDSTGTGDYKFVDVIDARRRSVLQRAPGR
jgi:GWxTD domain-containing protein